MHIESRTTNWDTVDTHCSFGTGSINPGKSRAGERGKPPWQAGDAELSDLLSL